MLKRLRLLAMLLTPIAGATPAGAQTEGAALFDRHCAMCHVGGDTGRAPSRDALRERTPESILNALVGGVMMTQGATLTDTERRTVAEYLAGRAIGTETQAVMGRCTQSPPFPDPLQGPRWNGWGVNLANSRFQTADQARLVAEQVPRLRLRWAFGFPGASSARAQPTVAAGRVFVGSETGVVYALDGKSGCTYWTFSATEIGRAHV